MAGQSAQDEIRTIQDKYGDDCRVIRDVGEFAYVIEITSHSPRFALKLQITDSYPTESPQIIVKIRQLPPSAQQELAAHLTSHADSLRGEPMIEHLLDIARTWLTDTDGSVTSSHDVTAATSGLQREPLAPSSKCANFECDDQHNRRTTKAVTQDRFCEETNVLKKQDYKDAKENCAKTNDENTRTKSASPGTGRKCCPKKLQHSTDASARKSSPRAERSSDEDEVGEIDCKTSPDKETISEKKPRMKTAVDVISRILWDDRLPKDRFTIGYLDRHLGVLEKPFSSFSWEDLASVDYDTLAIPKHRIQYFKYCDTVVWDKRQRLDNVFGSTGADNVVTIYDVIQQHDEKKSSECGNGDDSDDEDGVTILTGHESQYECSKFEHDKKAFSVSLTVSHDDESNGGNAEEGSASTSEAAVPKLYPREVYWGRKLRPTHFLALRITDHTTLANITSVQDSIAAMDDSYIECIIPPARIHLTLCCLGLDTPQHIQHATDTLTALRDELAMALTPGGIQLHIGGVGHFNNSTLYASVRETSNEDSSSVAPHRFTSWVRQLDAGLRRAGVEIRNCFDFVPHVTLLKVTTAVGIRRRCRFIESRIYQHLDQRHYGTQLVDSISLCEMSDEREDDGFYRCAARIVLTQGNETSK